MATIATDHYRAYTPGPFTRAERDSVTILFGGLHWRIERILQAVLEGSGYRARILPVATKEDLLTGRETADIGQCCPTSFTTGNLVNFLKKESKQVGVEEVGGDGEGAIVAGAALDHVAPGAEVNCAALDDNGGALRHLGEAAFG